MCWTNMSEKEMIKTWAAEKFSEEMQQEYLPQPDIRKESYWTEYDNGENITEYSFETVPELKKMLEREWTEEVFLNDLILPLAVAAFKERKIILQKENQIESRQDTGKAADEFSIPEFVYVF